MNTAVDSKKLRIVVAMSGGVDSSVTAALLKEQGHEVIGVTMQLYDHGEAISRPGTCCAGRDIRDARRVAESIGIPHYVVDYESTFEEDVIEPFAASYARGETPIPCILCNQTVKFRDLIKVAKDLDAHALATGHYVRRVEGPQMLRGAEHGRDQSYFLFATTKDQLEFLRFPLGDLSKNETRDMARNMGLSVAEKPDSQDICFVPDGDYASLVEKRHPDAAKPGKIVHVDGRVLGEHRGLIHYTVGQRRGVNIGGFVDPIYVVRLEPGANRVIVGPREALGRSQVVLRGVNWLGQGDTLPEDGIKVTVRLRSLHDPVPATVFGLDGGAAKVVLDAPFEGVAPGQACVFYQEERVLGGGWISGT